MPSGAFLLDSTTSRLRLLGLIGLATKLALIPLAFDPSADVSFVVPKALLSHGLSYVLVGVLLGLFIQSGRTFFVRSWMHVPVLLFLVASTLATAFAASPMLAVFGTHVRMLGLSTIADGIVTYFAAVHFIRREREAFAIGATVLVAALPILGYEALQLLGRDPFPWSIDGSVRPFSTIGQPTTLGEYLCILSVVAFGAALLARRVRLPFRLLVLAYSGLLLVGVGLTATRSAVVGLSVAGCVFVALVWAKHPNRSARRLGLVAGLAGAVAVAVVLILTPLGSRLASSVEVAPSEGTDEGTLTQLEPSVSARLTLYGIALEMVRDRPILGYGPDNFAVGVPKFRPESAPVGIRQSIATSAHSWIAAVATSSGLLGLLTFVGVVVVAFTALVRTTYRPVAVVAAVGVAAYLGTGLTTINAIETDTLFWLGIATIAGSLAETQGSAEVDRSPKSFKGRSRRQLIRSRQAAWLPVLAGLVLLASAFSAFDASRSVGQSQNSRTPAGAAQAIQLAARATREDPNRAEYWQALALADVAGTRWSDASVAFQRAAELAPYEIRFLTDSIQVQLVLANGGDTDALDRALNLANRAVDVDARNPRASLARAVVLQLRGDVEGALNSAERALALDPGSTNDQVYVTAAQTNITAGRFDEALRIAREGLALLGSTRRSVPVRVELARALASSGQTQEAVNEIDAALGLAPGDAVLLRLRAQIVSGQR